MTFMQLLVMHRPETACAVLKNAPTLFVESGPSSQSALSCQPCLVKRGDADKD